MIERIFVLLICHMIGDYVLQNNFLATTKGSNWYHLFVHSALYTVPFYLAFGFGPELILLLVSHFIIDALKARYQIIGYSTDQIWHFTVLIGAYIL